MTIEQVVIDYYPKVDASDIDWVLDIFADESCYVRADATYATKQDITDFYNNDRKISGKHSIKNLTLNNDNVIAVNGVFKGIGVDGAAKDIGFSDFWTFDKEGKVTLRETYLAAGANYVKD
ncbi:hypothetical protein RGQ13_08505 [Thalassotalea psychrophila]|uniref:SnoaL-like domain-containing protein n=1 Tax=Thalassotalea psychrophila TaxID=3065647 RepID=A0ABY9TZM2_9GAMM|nr:hypothetical protein RGQ13_08505 [Colwelliaceae bacterium SQ149]